MIAVSATRYNEYPIPITALDAKNIYEDIEEQHKIKPTKNTMPPTAKIFLQPYLLQICPAGMVVAEMKIETMVTTQFCITLFIRNSLPMLGVAREEPFSKNKVENEVMNEANNTYFSILSIKNTS